MGRNHEQASEFRWQGYVLQNFVRSVCLTALLNLEETMAKDIVKSIKLKSGKVREVRFTKIGPAFFIARTSELHAIRVHSSINGWSANNGGGRTYNNANPGKAFALAANDFWK